MEKDENAVWKWIMFIAIFVMAAGFILSAAAMGNKPLSDVFLLVALGAACVLIVVIGINS